jgi:hypothetical protein
LKKILITSNNDVRARVTSTFENYVVIRVTTNPQHSFDLDKCYSYQELIKSRFNGCKLLRKFSHRYISNLFHNLPANCDIGFLKGSDQGLLRSSAKK